MIILYITVTSAIIVAGHFFVVLLKYINDELKKNNSNGVC